MTTIKVPDMMCENCVKRITNALTAAELKFQVDLAEKKVTIDGCENSVTNCNFFVGTCRKWEPTFIEKIEMWELRKGSVAENLTKVGDGGILRPSFV